MKYYGTIVHGLFIPDEVVKHFGIKRNRHNQYRLVIKAKSRAAANRRWKELTGSRHDAFRPNYTSTTGNPTEIEFCDQHGEIIECSTSEGFISVSALMNEINKVKNNQ